MKKRIFALFFAVLAFSLSIFSLTACTGFDKSKTGDESVDVIQPCFDFTIKPHPHIMLASGDSSDAVTRTITATVYPDNATNKTVLWRLAWADSSVEGNPETYIRLSKLTSTSGESITVTCVASFENDILIIVTSYDQNFETSCLVHYVGVPTSMSVSFPYATVSSGVVTVGSNCDFYAVTSLSNPLGAIGDSYMNATVVVTGYGSIIVGDYTDSTVSGGSASWDESTKRTVTLDSLKDSFLKVTSTDGLTSTIHSYRTIEGYYASLTRMDGGRTKVYSDKYFSSVGDCYFMITISVPNTGLYKDYKVIFDPNAVSNISLSSSNLTF